ncbi:HAD-IA family hydrolase [candidate division WOR-3 bacterium]|nr:HAD-IA family hydrolase [candidate division WOR-3 bacterium]
MRRPFGTICRLSGNGKKLFEENCFIRQFFISSFDDCVKNIDQLQRKKNIKTAIIVFDLDGTLIDTSDDIVASINHTRNQFGLKPFPKKEAMKSIGQGFDNLIRMSLDRFGKDDGIVTIAKKVFTDHYIEHITDNSFPYDGITDALEILTSKGFSLCIATNKEIAMTEKLLLSLDIYKYFDIIVAGGMGISLKPEPDMIYKIQKDTNAITDRIAVVGDAWTDIQSARRAGCKSVLAQWGFKNTKGEKADFNASSPRHLIGIAENLFSDNQ